MKCQLEFKGKTYQSADYTDRHLSIIVATTGELTGFNTKELFESVFKDFLEASQESNSGELFGIKMLRSYDSLSRAERDFTETLKYVFPSFPYTVHTLGTEDLINIAIAIAGGLAPTPAVEVIESPEPRDEQTPMDEGGPKLAPPIDSPARTKGFSSRMVNKLGARDLVKVRKLTTEVGLDRLLARQWIETYNDADKSLSEDELLGYLSEALPEFTTAEHIQCLEVVSP